MRTKSIILAGLMWSFIIASLIAYVFPWRMSDERAYHTLEANGFKRENVQLGGIAFFGCDGMKLRRTFTVTRDGKQYEGRVCGNIFSGASVRID